MSLGDLCSVADVTAARRDATGGTRDALTARYITAASAVITRWTGRQFTLGIGPEIRRFPVEASDVSIDDLSAAPAMLRLVRPGGVDGSDITSRCLLLPRNPPPGAPITRVRLPHGVSCRNQDLEVTGVWGWPEVPADVREACVDVVCAWLALDSATVDMSGDRFEPGQPIGRALTLRAKETLRPFRRRMGIG